MFGVPSQRRKGGEEALRLTPTDEKVLQYIIDHKTPPGKDRYGRLQHSMMQIAQGINMSVSTVHRAIDRLLSKGYISVKPPMDKREPNIIEYMGRPEGFVSLGLIEQTKEKVEELASMLDTISLEYSRLLRTAGKLDQGSEEILPYLMNHRVIDVSSLPDGKKIVVLEPKINADDGVASKNGDPS